MLNYNVPIYQPVTMDTINRPTGYPWQLPQQCNQIYPSTLVPQQPLINQIYPTPQLPTVGMPPVFWHPPMNLPLQSNQVNCGQFINNSDLLDIERKSNLIYPEILKNKKFNKNYFYEEKFNDECFSYYTKILTLEGLTKIIRPDQIRIKINDVEKELVVITENMTQSIKLPDSIDIKQLQVRFIPVDMYKTCNDIMFYPQEIKQQFFQPKLLIKAPYKQNYTMNNCQALAIEHQLGGVVVKKYLKQLEDIFGDDRRQRLLKTRCVPTDLSYYENTLESYDLAGVRKTRRFQIELDLVETKHFLPQQVLVKSVQRKNKLTNLDETVLRVEAKRVIETDGSQHELIREFVVPSFVETSKVIYSVGPFDGTVRIVLPCHFEKLDQLRQEQKIHLK